MKKTISTLLLISMLALIPALPASALAAPLPEVPGSGLIELKPCPGGTFRVRRNTRTKKKLVNSLIAGGIGTAIGAGIAGKRGALIGAGSGAGGYLVYRYVRDRRGRCVARRV